MTQTSLSYFSPVEATSMAMTYHKWEDRLYLHFQVEVARRDDATSLWNSLLLPRSNSFSQDESGHGSVRDHLCVCYYAVYSW
ncbi:hypothetical protein GQ600_9433 [Phytophthora cactorum]|nr:hypothetical protein GQ600_9433 [Phytophthora cactorum]